MGEIGPEKIILLLLVVLLLFGAKRLPEIGQSLGKGIREFKSSLSGVGDALGNAPPDARRPLRDAPPAETARPDEHVHQEPRRLMVEVSCEP